MLFNAKNITSFNLNCSDGEIGKVKEFYFDDKHWTVRYLVAETGNWLLGRQILISPYALISVNEKEQDVSVQLTKKQVEDSPSLFSDKPVSRQFEESYYGYYGWPLYWYGSYSWGYSPFLLGNRDPYLSADKPRESNQGGKEWDPELRSTHDVTGHHIQALDGELGHVEDFIIDDETWAIRYLVVETGSWWSGKKVLLSPRWIDRVSWSEAKVYVGLTLDAIKNAPEFTDKTLLTHDYEVALSHHYDREGYWTEEAIARAHVL